MENNVEASEKKDFSEQKLTSFKEAVAEIFSDTNFNIKLFTELVGAVNLLEIVELLERETERLFDNMPISELSEFLSRGEEGVNELKKFTASMSVKSQQAEKLIEKAYAFYYKEQI